MQTWEIEDAKARFLEVIELAEHDGPQQISLGGRPVGILLSPADFDKLCGRGRSFVEFMQGPPLYGLDDAAFEREQTGSRDISL
nr:type II toxin-antitoxin system prevent-host-death family antitoxin [uncultured Noviherbaspirillum sp.]